MLKAIKSYTQLLVVMNLLLLCSSFQDIHVKESRKNFSQTKKVNPHHKKSSTSTLKKLLVLGIAVPSVIIILAKMMSYEIDEHSNNHFNQNNDDISDESLDDENEPSCCICLEQFCNLEDTTIYRWGACGCKTTIFCETCKNRTKKCPGCRNDINKQYRTCTINEYKKEIGEDQKKSNQEKTSENSNDNIICSICQGKLNDEFHLIKTQCKHFFHKSCMNDFILGITKNREDSSIELPIPTTLACPICRFFLNEEEIETVPIKIT